MTFLRFRRTFDPFGYYRAQKLAILSQEAANAREAYDAACARGDTRAQHTTLKALQDATHALMRAEVGR